MILFDFRLMFKMFCRSLCGEGRSRAPLTLKRMAVLAAFFPLFLLMEITNRLGFFRIEFYFPILEKLR